MPKSFSTRSFSTLRNSSLPVLPSERFAFWSATLSEPVKSPKNPLIKIFSMLIYITKYVPNLLNQYYQHVMILWETYNVVKRETYSTDRKIFPILF